MVKQLLTNEQFDLINIHHASGGFAAACARFLLGNRVPSVFFFQGPWLKEAIAGDGNHEDYSGKRLYRSNILFEEKLTSSF